MTAGQKFKAMTLVVLSLGTTFLAPLIAAYFLLAKRETQEKFIAGAVFWIVASIIIGALVIYINRQFTQAKANVFKTIFKGVRNIALLGFVWFALTYIELHMQNLIYTVAISMASVILGKVFEMIAVIKYKEFIREVGVF